MGRPRDTFWQYAHPESNNGRFKCNFCDKDFAGGISRIKSHLSGIKGRDIDICLKVPDHIRAEARQAIDGSLPCKKKGKKTIESPPCKKKRKRIISISDDDDDETVFVGTTAEQHAIESSPSNNKGGKSVVVAAPNDDEIVVDEDEPNSARLLLTASCTSRESRKKELDKQFLKCYEIMDGVSKEASQLLVQLVKGVSVFGQNYELPNLATPDEQILEYERGVKESWRETGFTLMIVDGEYNEESEELNVNVFAYCPKGMLLLKSGNFSAAIDVIAEFGARHCLQAIALSDYTEAIDLAVEIKDSCHGVLLRSPSPIYIIQHFVEIAIETLDQGFEELLDAVEIIFTYMWKFSLVWRRKIFNEWKKHTRLKCTYPEEYSHQLMLLRPVIEHEAEVVSTVQSMDISKWVADVVTSKELWTLGKQLIHIIDNLFPLAHLVQGRVPAFGYFYEAVNKACDALDQFSHKDPTRYRNLKMYNELKWWRENRTLRGMIKPIHAAACLLNPAIMCGENFKEESQMMEGINELKKNFFVDQADRDLFLSQVELYRAKSPSIFTAKAYRKSKTLHPWVWWREFGGRVPELQKCAIQILSQPCDVPLWTQDLQDANNASERRKVNLSLMEKFSGSEASSLEPIDLETAVESCEYEEQEYFDDLFTSSNPAATLGLECLDLESIDLEGEHYQSVHDFFLATTDTCDFGPNYELPNLATPEEQILEYERGVKASWRETGFTLMFAPVYDGLDEELNVNVFAYCPKGMLLLTSGNFSAACTAVAGVIAEFGQRHCLQAIALDDQELISLQLVKMMKANYLGVFLTNGSPIKVIHNLVEYYVSYVNGFCELLDAVDIIFTYMWKFSLVWRRKIFNEWKKHTRLECTYPEFYSDRLMLLRPVIEHEAEVKSTVQSMDISKWVSDVVTNIKFWTIGKELIHIIDILFPLARLVQGTVPAFGYFYEAVNKASDALDECYHKDPTRYRKLKSLGLDTTLREMIEPIHAAACLLNPAIMCGENFKEESQMMRGINELKENFFVDQADRDLFLSQVELYRAKSPSIFTATAYRKSKTLHPGVWWREFGGRVPELQKCAIQILSQPCDVPLWTRDLPAANNASERRKLKLSLMEKFSGSEASSLEPIDLETEVESCEYEEQEYFDDLSTSNNPAATLGLQTRFLDPEIIDLSNYPYPDVHDFFLANHSP